MKKSLLLLTLLMFIMSSANAQLYSDIQSILSADTTSDCRNYYSTKDNAGNTILTGQFVGTVLFSGSALTLSYPEGWGPGPEHPASYKTFIAKLNSDGTWAWAKKIDNTSFFVNGVAADASDNIFIVGQFTGTTNLDGVTITSTGPYYSDIFVAKMNSSGAFLWAKKEGTNKGPDYGRDIALDGSGNVIISGSFTNKRLNCGICSLAFASDIFIAKYSSAGVKLWSKNIGNTAGVYVEGWGYYGLYTNTGFTLSTDGSGNIYVGGQFLGTLKFNNITINAHAANFYDAFAAKFNSSGTTQWVKTGYTSDNTVFDRISIDNSGNLYFIGSGIGGTGTLVFNGTTYSNVTGKYLIKLNNSGSPQWTSNITSGCGGAVSVLVNTEGNIDVLGFFACGYQPVGVVVDFLNEYNSSGTLLFTESLANVLPGDLCKNASGVTLTMNFQSSVTLLTTSGDVTITSPFPTNPSSSTPEIYGVFIATYTPSAPLLVAPPYSDMSFDASGNTIELEVFPNPVSDNIEIHLKSSEFISELAIYDQIGRRIWNQQVEEGETILSIDLSGSRFGNGIYYVSTISNGEKITRRFVIEK